MVRLGFDWIDVVLSDNHFSLNERVLPAYLAAYDVLHRSHLERIERYTQKTKAARSEEEYADARGDLMDEEYRWHEQTQALAAMALTLAASANKSFLDQMKRLFASTHPPVSRYAGRSQLMRQVAEYRARFGVDLERINFFETIREIELARHCCVHDDGRLSEDYSIQTKRRLVGVRGYIDLTPEMLTTFLSELEGFAGSLCTEMKSIRDSHHRGEIGEQAQ